MSTSLEERLYARELRALYRANRHSLEPFNVAQSEAFQREARRRARLRAQDPRELEAHVKPGRVSRRLPNEGRKMNPEDLARRRWRPVAKAVEKRNRLGAELAKTNERLVLLRNELPQAEQADRESFAVALAASKAEPDRMAEHVAANIAAEERRSEALQTAVQQAARELQKVCEQNRPGWYRDTLAAIGKAHRIYEEAIDAVAHAREGLADEVALADWIRGGVGVSPIVDTLARSGGEALSFSRVLQALNADAEQVAGHLPEPEPRMSWQRVREHAEALVGQGLSREEAVKQAGGPRVGGRLKWRSSASVDTAVD